MAVDADNLDSREQRANWLADRRIAIGGRLEGMSQRAAAETLRRFGATIVDVDDAQVELLLVADAAPTPTQSHAQILRESNLWQRLGLVDEPDVRRLYTPAMLAELVGASVASVRRWHRQGALVATQCVRRLPYFDFTETAVARKLSALANAGCSLGMIDRRLARLAALLPDVERPLADPRVVVDGRRLYLRRGDDLSEPGGQLLLDLDAGETDDVPPAVLALHAPSSGETSDDLLARLRLAALDYEGQGELELAADAYRSLLAAGGPSAEVHFALADVLYRQGDLSAARERFYAALELDEQYVEARFNLGCVMAETGELELAAAAFEGTLDVHPDYADAHFHLACALERLGRVAEAADHFRSFLERAPESPWAAAARARLGQTAPPAPRAVVGND